MHPTVYRAITFAVFVVWSFSCNKSEVVANYKNERTFSSTTQGADAAANSDGASADGQDVETAALAIIQRSCAKCHAGGAASGGFGIIDDVEALIASNKYIIPGDAAASAIYKRIAVAKSMPPAGPLATADADIIKQWIDAL